MTVIDKSFDSYTITYVGGPGPFAPYPAAVIHCYQTNTLVGTIEFRDQNIVNNYYSNNVIYLEYHLDRFNDVLRIIQSEKPLFLRFITINNYAAIGTGSLEPVGEEEG